MPLGFGEGCARSLAGAGRWFVMLRECVGEVQRRVWRAYMTYVVNNDNFMKPRRSKTRRDFWLCELNTGHVFQVTPCEAQRVEEGAGPKAMPIPRDESSSSIQDQARNIFLRKQLNEAGVQRKAKYSLSNIEFTQFDHLEEHVRSREDEYAAVGHSRVDLKMEVYYPNRQIKSSFLKMANPFQTCHPRPFVSTHQTLVWQMHTR